MMKKALENLDPIFSSDKIYWDVDLKFWLKCFTRVQQMPNAQRIFKRISNARRDDIQDFLSEVWFAVLFSMLGFQVGIEPSGKSSDKLPDLELTGDHHSAVVEVKHLRRVYHGPPEIGLDDKHPVFPVYGDIERDTKKACGTIRRKFAQITAVKRDTSIIALWNSDGDLEEIEVKEAVRRLSRVSGENSVPNNLAFVVFGPLDDHFRCFAIRSDLEPYQRSWMQWIEEMTIQQFKRAVLYFD